MELKDPSGGNPKCRPAVIIDPAGKIESDSDVWVVAISTQVSGSPSEVELPWERSGHPKTRLKERCAAVCNWRLPISLSKVQEYAGMVPAKQMLEILRKVDDLSREENAEL